MGEPSVSHIATEKRLFFIIASGLLWVAYVVGLFVFPMDIDSAQYAAMSMEMWQNQSFLKITNLGKPYLDKPPLIFWLSSCSMGILGFHAWAFKLPSFLSTCLGFYSIYRLTLRLYNHETALKAFLILASSVAWLIFNNDVRTDALLVNFVIFSSWQFVEWYVSKKNIHLPGLAVGIALAMLAKGPIGAVAVGVWGTSWLIFHRDWKSIFHVRWIGVALLVIILLIPMCWGLYQQHGWEGIRFFFWTQSFGRVTGESQWVNHPGPVYFFPVLAWSFLPWTPFLVWGLIASTMKKIEFDTANKALFVSSLILFAALSLSRYKLPHYIFIILPWLSVLTARWISINNRLFFKRFSLAFTWILMSLTTFFIPIFFQLFLPTIPLIFWIFWVSVTVLIMLIISKWKETTGALALITAAIFIALNAWFYPNLLAYQGTSQIGSLARYKKITPEKIRVCMPFPAYALTFAYQHVLTESEPWKIHEELQYTDHLWVICDKFRRDYMQEIGIQISEEYRADQYPVSRLKLDFLNKHTRQKLLLSIYLCKVTR